MAVPFLQLSPKPVRPPSFDGYWIEVTCPADGAALAHTTDDEPTSNVRRAVAVCTKCAAEYRLTVTLLPTEGIGLRED